MLESKITLALVTILKLGQGLFGGYAALQILSGLFSISRKNQQKKTEGIDHLGWVAISIIGVLLIQPIVTWLQSL